MAAPPGGAGRAGAEEQRAGGDPLTFLYHAVGVDPVYVHHPASGPVPLDVASNTRCGPSWVSWSISHHDPSVQERGMREGGVRATGGRVAK